MVNDLGNGEKNDRKRKGFETRTSHEYSGDEGKGKSRNNNEDS